MAIYNTIGKAYNVTRKADPYITGRLHYLLNPLTTGKYVDIGCGTGNYTTALSDTGLEFYGIEPSDIMIEKARNNNCNVRFIQASAEKIPLPDTYVHGAIATFTLHHWKNLQKGINEVYRILKQGCNFVILSFTPEQMLGYWLHHYFPKMIESSMKTIPAYKTMESMLQIAGFKTVSTEKYFVQKDLQDHFLYSNKFKPEQYLLPEIRENISSFKLFAGTEELYIGLSNLETDIRNGKINSIIKSYENEMGDYLFIIATK